MDALVDIELVSKPPDDLEDIPAPARSLRPFRWSHMGIGDEDRQISLRGYFATVSYLDYQLGRVLDALERLGQADRTIVLFFGDHGWHLGEHTLSQEMSLMEEPVKPPLIILAPGMCRNGRA